MLSKLFPNDYYWKHENRSVAQSLAATSKPESRVLPQLAAVLGCWVLGALLYNAIQILVSALFFLSSLRTHLLRFDLSPALVFMALIVEILTRVPHSPVCHTFSTRCGCVEKVGKIICDGMDVCPHEACDHMVRTFAESSMPLLRLVIISHSFPCRLAVCVTQRHIGAGNAVLFIREDRALKSDALVL